MLGGRFTDAFGFAHSLHRRQLRKGGDVPYMAHLMGAASLVLEDGGDEDETIAALLHDAVEDQGGVPVLNEIRRRYGDRVARLVEECTDHDPAQDRPEWHLRKKAYVEAIAERPDSHRVALADKVYNAREILHAYRQVGERVWARFSAGREVLGYLRALADAFGEHAKSPLAAELDMTVSELERLATDATA
ncbi:MAG: HD domain-containing protein [Euzebyales bacterium]|nr:HD domain-containing protein [Euzebyales bacterium]